MFPFDSSLVYTFGTTKLKSNVRSNHVKGDNEKDVNGSCGIDFYKIHHAPKRIKNVGHNGHSTVSRTILLQIEPALDGKQSTLDKSAPKILNPNKMARKSSENGLNVGKYMTYAKGQATVTVSSDCHSLSTIRDESESDDPTDDSTEDNKGFHLKCRAQGKCKDLFESYNAMTYHVSTYHARRQDQNTFQCYSCKILVAGRQSLQRHMNAAHFRRIMYKCSFSTCNQSFNRKYNLKRHINGIHTKELVHKCTKCPKTYYYRHLLANHLANKHGKDSAKAHQKPKEFIECSAKTIVKQNNVIGRPFECYSCKKIYTERHSLRRHMDLEHNRRSGFECAFPTNIKTCPKKIMMKKPVKGQNRFRAKFQCAFAACSRTFNRKSDLDKHIKLKISDHIRNIHFPAESFDHQCTECFKKFRFKYALKSHLASEHGNMAEVPRKRKHPVKYIAEPKRAYLKKSDLESDKSKMMTSKDRNDKNMDSTDDEDTNSTVVFADPCELIKNEPPIDIDVDAAEKAVADPSNSIMWRPSDEEATPNLDKNESVFVGEDESILDSTETTYCGENVISIKNEPDTELDEAPNCTIASESGSCESEIPELSLVKDESESEVDIDGANDYLPDSLTPQDTMVMKMSTMVKNETESEVEIDDGNEASSLTRKNRREKSVAAKNRKKLNGKAVTKKNIVKFTVRCERVGKCKELFQNLEALEYHVATYHARRQNLNTFQCHLCRKILGEKQSHQRHMNLYHFGQSLFKCSFGTCGKSFPRQDYLEKHINAMHTQKNLLQCTECSKKFHFKYNLVRHLSYMHDIGILYSCYICKMRLAEKRSLQSHMISQHTGQYRLKCPVCSGGFTTKRNLKRHFKRFHFESKKKCS